jgi:very-short-patch-repair endonuclease
MGLLRRYAPRNDMWLDFLQFHQLEGLKFRRQEPIGDYIVDFVCFERKIIIEIDGGQHAIEQEKNVTRSRAPSRQGRGKEE